MGHTIMQGGYVFKNTCRRELTEYARLIDTQWRTHQIQKWSSALPSDGAGAKLWSL